MKIRAIVWDLVEVTCPDDSSHNATYKKAYVSLTESEELHIEAPVGLAIYLKAEIIELSPTSMKIFAYWWQEGNRTLIPVDILATL